jgi:hypothetical protein
MNRLKSRIQRLEYKTGLSLPEILDLFTLFPGPEPVIGWRIQGMDIATMTVTRLDGESEDELRDRAVEAANAIPNRRYPFLFVQMRLK